LYILIITRHNNEGEVLDGAVVDFDDCDFPGNDEVIDIVYSTPLHDAVAIIASVFHENEVVLVVERLLDNGEN